jgi:tryptophanyl-tRNA synthetase
MKYSVDILTGIRPSGALTVANYISAIQPIFDLQNSGSSVFVFVADLHALTDLEPTEANDHIEEVVADYMALGLDPAKTKIYRQSDIMSEVAQLTSILSRHITVSELLRIPTLKDKLKTGARPETANALLLMYPIIMAADILLPRSHKVPIGEDQMPHMEVTRLLVRRFNNRYGEVFPMPEALTSKPVRVLSLKGEGKMSKTKPSGAIFLNDDIKTIGSKIKSAETATEGEMNPRLESHISLAKSLASNQDQIDQIDRLITDHMSKKQVMGEFKELLTTITVEFLKQFQIKRGKIIRDKQLTVDILEDGGASVRVIADETLKAVKQAMKFGVHNK